MKIIIDIIGSVIINIAMLYIWYKLLNKPINLKEKRLYISFVILVLTTILNYFLVNHFIKVIIITIIFMFVFKFLFREGIQKSVLTPIFYQVIIMVSELLFAFIVILFNNNDNQLLLNTYIGTIFGNIFIALICVLIFKFKFIRNVYNKLIEFTDKITPIQLCGFSIMIITIINIVLAATFYKVAYIFLFIINTIILLISFIIIFYTFKTQNNFNKVSDKYNIAIKSLTDYENMMTKYRIANHENKNLLLTIRAMILNKEKDIPKYIDTMIEDKYEDDEKLLFKMAVIPSGGLRASIYSEIMKIKDNHINYSLDIDKKLRTIDLIELDTNTIVDICKIIGVFIDNAIDETKKLKNKNIEISLYLEKNKLNIKVSNNYKGNIDVTKLSNSGYTTKGKGHGYGLSLVKEIVKNNNLFENKVEINSDLFSQILIIKYKKSH